MPENICFRATRKVLGQTGKPIRVVELFSGIGAQRAALKRAGIPHETVAVCEIDEHAYASYCAIHGFTPNMGDITKVERLPDDIDLVTYSFPCQDLSIAGKCRGMAKDSGTRSGTCLWNVGRLLLEAESRGQLPDALLMENVDAIANSKNKKDFDAWIGLLSEMGYTSSWKVLNAKDFDVPQNRSRCYMVSCLDSTYFRFPEGRPKTKRLKDVLEAEVDEKYYLSPERISRLIEHKERHRAQGHGFGFSITDVEGDAKCVKTRFREEEDTLIQVAQLEGKHEQTGRVYSPEGDCPAINTRGGGDRQPKILIHNNTKKGFLEASDGDGLYIHNISKKRGTVQKDMISTLKCGADIGCIQDSRIRRLTPHKCWRVMDLSDDDYDKAKSVGTSDTQLYKQAGNSICVGVLVDIFREFYTVKQCRQPSLFDFGTEVSA